jgi:hypothetical protein
MCTYPKLLSKGIVQMVAVANVNGYEIVNEYIPGDRPGQLVYNSWYIMDGNKQVAIKDKKGKFISFPNFISQEEAEQYALSKPPASSLSSWEEMEIFEINCKYGNGESLNNPQVQKVTYNGHPMTWNEWEKMNREMAAEKKVKVLYLAITKELVVTEK